jgi:AraC-like DNA-binding protein
MTIKTNQTSRSFEDASIYEYGIGADITLIGNAEASRASRFIGHPFKIDESMTIIYDQGEVIFNINMQQYHIKAPAVIVVMTGQTCELISYSNDLRCRIIAMSRFFTDNMFESLTSKSQGFFASMLENPILGDENDTYVFNQYYEMLQNIAKSPLSEFKIEAARHLTLAMFYGYSYTKHKVSNNLKGTDRQIEIYTLFLNALNSNFKTEREVRFYADKLCVTAKHLSHVVKEVVGKSALDIIEEYVITESKALLLSTNMSIQQIGENLNFPSQSVFGKYFRRITGISPSEYRKIKSRFVTTSISE